MLNSKQKDISITHSEFLNKQHLPKLGMYKLIFINCNLVDSKINIDELINILTSGDLCVVITNAENDYERFSDSDHKPIT
jgi:hypothetical protein